MPKKVICSKTKFEAIKKVLEDLLPDKKLIIDELAKKTNKNVAWLNNVVPIMVELGLVYRGFDENIGIIGITHKGIELIEIIEDGSDKKIREFGESIYKKSDILRIARRIISENPDIKISELGMRIADGLDIPEVDKWKNEVTYVVVARSCLSILNGLKLVDYQPMKYTRSNVDRFKNKLMPYASTVLIDKLLKDFKNDIYEIEKEDFNQYQRQRKTDYFNCAIMLGLIERVPGDKYSYKLTSDGKNLRDAEGFSGHAKIFQEILLKNPHIVEILRTIKNNYEEISAEEIGSIVGDYNNSKWSKTSKLVFGNNFLNWLLESDIMVHRGRKHKYSFYSYFLDSDNYKRFFENNYDVPTTTIEENHEICEKINNVQKNQTVKLVHKNPSLDLLNNEELLNKVITKIDIILYDKIENWDKCVSEYQDIIDLYVELEKRMNNEYRLISSASYDFTKGYLDKDENLLKNAQKNNTYLLELERFKG